MGAGNLFVISGPSGAGKGTLVARLLQESPASWLSISATTRQPREGEVDGVNYFFVTRDAFEQMIRRDELLEWAQYSENYYGTPRESVAQKIGEGRNVILEIDVQGAFQVREKMPEATLIFIEPPSFEELERRLRERGTEDEETILKRLEAARVELSRKEEYDIRLVNDDLDVAVAELVGTIEGTRENTRGLTAHEHYRTQNRRLAR